MNIFKITVNCGWANNTSMESAEIEEIFNLLKNFVLQNHGERRIESSLRVIRERFGVLKKMGV